MKEFRNPNFEDHASFYASYDLKEASERLRLMRSLRGYDSETPSITLLQIAAITFVISLVTALF